LGSSGGESLSHSWPFRGSAFHLDSRTALVKSVEPAAKQQQQNLSDGLQAVFGSQLHPTNTTGQLLPSHTTTQLPMSLPVPHCDLGYYVINHGVTKLMTTG